MGMTLVSCKRAFGGLHLRQNPHITGQMKINNPSGYLSGNGKSGPEQLQVFYQSLINFRYAGAPDFRLNTAIYCPGKSLSTLISFFF